ncbi:MAG: acyl-CoA reductase [Sediminibacterium sp.]
MEIQARIAGFVALGQQLMRQNNPALEEVKQRAQTENAWFLPSFIDASMKQISRQFLQEPALMEWTSLYPNISKTFTQKKIGIVMAGNIPMVGFHDLLSTLMAGHIAVVKLSSKDKVLMDYIIQSLKTIEPLWEDQIIIQDQLKNCDAYIATGSNNTSQYFEYYFGKFPHIIRKNKTSIAILEGNETAESLSLLADDMMLYFGMGCRNVTQLWVPNGYNFEPLLAALKKYDFILDNHKYKHNYDYQLALLMMTRQFYMNTGSILLSENSSPFAAISQVHYQYYEPGTTPEFNMEEIQCIVGKAGLDFGSLQAPKLSQYADGVDTLAFLSGLN